MNTYRWEIKPFNAYCVIFVGVFSSPFSSEVFLFAEMILRLEMPVGKKPPWAMHIFDLELCYQHLSPTPSRASSLRCQTPELGTL